MNTSAGDGTRPGVARVKNYFYVKAAVVPKAPRFSQLYNHFKTGAQSNNNANASSNSWKEDINDLNVDNKSPSKDLVVSKILHQQQKQQLHHTNTY